MKRFFSYILAVSFLLAPLPGHAQQSDAGKGLAGLLLSEDALGRSVGFLSDTLCSGRATATTGAVEASFWLARSFERMGLLAPGMDGTAFVRSFQVAGKAGHNVIGICPAPGSDKYAIVAAHYDNLGVLSDRMYPGADSNASGVAAMLGLARICRSLSVLGLGVGQNVIFVALDAKQLSMAGSVSLYEMLSAGSLSDPLSGRPITLDRVSMMVNLDIVGSTLEPVTKGREEYLIMLSGDDTLKQALSEANYRSGLGLDLSFDYYSSREFTDLFMNRIGDQRVFVEGGVPSVLFTSGITMNTNNVEDTPETLDMAVLRKRILLIFNWMSLVLR